ncbi:MAG: hypothetical protein M1835_000051 [Candelina submexicana]|nr:MAG: hypothetical protein M1835_000051 [Candelina submexicana]
MSSSLTPLERSRQARGKDITEKPKATSSKGKSKEAKTSNERFEDRERKQTAATVLESTELLIFHAHANNETRLRFEKMLIGIQDSSDEWEDDLDDDDEQEIVAAVPQRAPKGPEKGEGSKKRAAR